MSEPVGLCLSLGSDMYGVCVCVCVCSQSFWEAGCNELDKEYQCMTIK